MPSESADLSTPRFLLAATDYSAHNDEVGILLYRYLIENTESLALSLFGNNFSLASLFSRQLQRIVPCLDPQVSSLDAALYDLYLSSFGSTMMMMLSEHPYFNGGNHPDFYNCAAEFAQIATTPVVLNCNLDTLGESVVSVLNSHLTFVSKSKICAAIITTSLTDSPADILLINNYEDLIRKHLPQLNFVILNNKLLLGLEETLNRTSNYSIGFNALAVLKDYFRQLDSLQLVAQVKQHSPKVRVKQFIAPADPTDSTFIAVAADAAFSQHYQNNLNLLQAAGAKLKHFSPMVDSRIPAGSKAVYLPGIHQSYLNERLTNAPIKAQLKRFYQQGGVIYLEAGALALFGQKITPAGSKKAFEGWGILPLSTTLQPERSAHPLVRRKRSAASFSHSNILHEQQGEHDARLKFSAQESFRFSSDQKIRAAVISGKQAAPGAALFATFGGQNFASSEHICFSSNSTIAENFVANARESAISA